MTEFGKLLRGALAQPHAQPAQKGDMANSDLNVAGKVNPQLGVGHKTKKKRSAFTYQPVG
jgi:hypothetical protein